MTLFMQIKQEYNVNQQVKKYLNKYFSSFQYQLYIRYYTSDYYSSFQLTNITTIIPLHYDQLRFINILNQEK